MESAGGDRGDELSQNGSQMLHELLSAAIRASAGAPLAADRRVEVARREETGGGAGARGGRD